MTLTYIILISVSISIRIDLNAVKYIHAGVKVVTAHTVPCVACDCLTLWWYMYNLDIAISSNIVVMVIWFVIDYSIKAVSFCLNNIQIFMKQCIRDAIAELSYILISIAIFLNIYNLCETNHVQLSKFCLCYFEIDVFCIDFPLLGDGRLLPRPLGTSYGTFGELFCGVWTCWCYS